MRCRLCRDNNCEPFYQGPIRTGGINSEETDEHQIFKCPACSYGFLHPLPHQSACFYESEAYRELIDSTTEVEILRQKYDHEQNERIRRIGIERLRNSAVADFGAGPGLFLSIAGEVAQTTIAIEPTKAFHPHLEEEGHLVFPYAEQAKKAGVSVDLAVSFDTIEHLENPLEFLEDIFEILNPRGTLVLSMPNWNDLLLHTAPSAFRPFFYQTVHLGYFGKKSTRAALKTANFENIEIGFLHKYTIENLVQWASNGKAGKLTLPCFDNTFDKHYKSEVERLEVASHVFATARKPARTE